MSPLTAQSKETTPHSSSYEALWTQFNVILNTEGRQYPYFYLEVNLSMIRAHVHPQESGWEMRAALSTWGGFLKDFIPTVYPHGSAKKTFNINLSGPWILPHTPNHHPIFHIAVLMGWWVRKRNLISKLTEVLGPSGSSWKERLVQSKHPLGPHSHTPDFAKQRPGSSQWEKTDYSFYFVVPSSDRDWPKGFP